MKKNQYIAPAICITTVGLENMIARSSGPATTSNAASQDAGMDVKAASREDYNVWDEDWSK